MERAVVIANPAASQFTGGAHRDVMATLTETFDVEAIWPNSAADATKFSRKAAKDGKQLVVAMGGDGMVHHVAQGLIGTETRLGAIPVGTTNVIARLLDLPSSPIKAARLLASAAPPSLVGTVRMELKRGTTESRHHALFACGLGLDADVVIEADKEPYRKYRFGSLHYARTALSVALRSFPKRKPHVTVTAGDRSAVVAAAVLQFRSLYTYFGRLPLSIGDDPPDPMTLLLIERLKRRKVPAITTRAITGKRLDAVDGLEIWYEVDSLGIEADPPVAAQADGESLGMIDSAEITWDPDTLRIVRGQPSD
jgi:diacylglycerol kinase family enzyme